MHYSSTWQVTGFATRLCTVTTNPPLDKQHGEVKQIGQGRAQLWQ